MWNSIHLRCSPSCGVIIIMIISIIINILNQEAFVKGGGWELEELPCVCLSSLKGLKGPVLKIVVRVLVSVGLKLNINKMKKKFKKTLRIKSYVL